MMDEIALLLLRLIAYLIIEVIIGTILYWLGWPFVKLVTWGRYPKRKWAIDSVESNCVVAAGLAAWVMGVMAALGQFAF